MNLEQLFGKWFAFLRDGLTGRMVLPATKSDIANDPFGEGWIIVLTTAGTVRCLPAGNPEGSTVDLVLKVNEIIPCKVKRVYSTGTDAVGVYLIK